MSIGVKVSRTGIDVRTAGILDQEFNSDHNSLKIRFTGTLTSTASGNRTVTFSYGALGHLGYICWFEVDSSGKWFTNFCTDHLSGKSVFVSASTSDTGLSVDIYSSSSATVKIFYMIFADLALV